MSCFRSDAHAIKLVKAIDVLSGLDEASLDNIITAGEAITSSSSASPESQPSQPVPLRPYPAGQAPPATGK